MHMKKWIKVIIKIIENIKGIAFFLIQQTNIESERLIQVIIFKKTKNKGHKCQLCFEKMIFIM